MIVLNVIYKCKPSAREAFLHSVTDNGIDVASRNEEGNLKYEYYLSTDNEDEVLLVEKWKDADSVASHGKQPHYAKLGELKAEYVLETIIDRFEI